MKVGKGSERERRGTIDVQTQITNEKREKPSAGLQTKGYALQIIEIRGIYK